MSAKLRSAAHLVLGLITGCAGTSGSDPEAQMAVEENQAPPDDLVSFEESVHPILVARCGGCHDIDVPGIPGHGAADPDEAFAATQAMSMDEPVYRRILARASGQDPAGFMPPPYAGCAGPLGAPGCLSVEEFELIELWVDQGASYLP